MLGGDTLFELRYVLLFIFSLFSPPLLIPCFLSSLSYIRLSSPTSFHLNERTFEELIPVQFLLQDGTTTSRTRTRRWNLPPNITYDKSVPLPLLPSPAHSRTP